MPFTAEEQADLPQIISAPRFATYLHATNNDTVEALSLYQWNLQISSAFIVPLQVCEVAARNGVASAIEKQYGVNWHQSHGFLQSLPQSKYGYCPKSDFETTIKKLRRQNSFTSGKVVAELKFAFWENMLTKRHDQRLWQNYFEQAFPYADISKSVFFARREAKMHLEKVRQLRNRIAHHEPIFIRNIEEEYKQIIDIIRWRSLISAEWVGKIQTVSELDARKPNL